MGMLVGFVVQKNPDLIAGDPRRKFKGRVVFQGNNVVNQHWEAAAFQDLGDTLATMDASRIADWYGCLLNGPFTASYPYFQQLTLNKCSLSKLLMAIFEPGTAGVRCDCCVTTTALLRVPNSEILFKVEQNSRQKRPRLVNFNARLFKLGSCIFK